LTGEVLVAGGNGAGAAASLATTELYDPVAGTWSLTTGSMTNGRASHTATLLPNGMVLVVGGTDSAGNGLASAELFNPTTGTWTVTGSLNHARAYHTATLTTNGVLIAGGVNVTTLVPIAELYDLTLGTFSNVGALSNPRQLQTDILFTAGSLANEVLLIGGVDGSFNNLGPTDLFTPVGNTFSASGSLLDPRRLHTSTLLISGANDGKVLVEGGVTTSAGNPDDTTEIFDPTTATFSAGPNMVYDHAAHTATLFTSGPRMGQILVAAGATHGGFLTPNDELYDPVANSFSATCNLIQSRESHTATLLLNGNVLIAGGFIVGGGISECELYSP
jgi:phage baseplate assembly protein gpV